MATYPSLPETRVMPLVKLRRDRVLPMPGEVTVGIGSRVDPLDVVARSMRPSEMRAVPLTRVMGLRERDIARNLQKSVGDPIQEQEVLISKRLNIFDERLIYRSPGSGRIAALQGSWLLLELNRAPVELPALYRGTVVNVVPRGGVTIETEGAWAQGLWGSGHEGYGVLKVMTADGTQALTAERIDVSARGTVLVAGTVDAVEVLDTAAQANVAGLVLGSLPPEWRLRALELGLPVLITDGFGRVPMAAPIFDLLHRFNGNEVSLNAVMQARPGGSTARPEVFIPVVRSGGVSDAQGPVALGNQPGAQVRVTREPWLGQTGTIVEAAEPRVIETGARCAGAIVELSAGGVFVPWTNLELIG